MEINKPEHALTIDDTSSQGKVKDVTNRLAPAQAMSEEEFAIVEKRLKRKLDLRLLAMV